MTSQKSRRSEDSMVTTTAQMQDAAEGKRGHKTREGKGQWLRTETEQREVRIVVGLDLQRKEKGAEPSRGEEKRRRCERGHLS